MGKEPRKVHKIYEELRDRTTYPLLFYLPRKIFEVFIEEKALNDIDWVFDVLIMARKEMDIIFIADKDESQEVLKKQSILNGNLFDLAEYESELNPVQFSILINKYKDHLFAMHYISELILKDVNSGDDEKYKKYIAFFRLQEVAFMMHKSAIDNDFPSFRRTQAEEHLLRESLMDNFNIAEIFKEKNVLPQQKVKRKKVQLITDAESQKYLLAAVFSLKME
jgi:hypothetical protein